MLEPAERNIFRQHLDVPCLLFQRSGEWLLYLFFAMPFAVDQRLALVSLTTPRQADLFGTVWPYYSAIEFASTLIACGLSLFGARALFGRHRILIVYSIINVIAIVCIPLFKPNGEPLYWDYAIEFLRFISVALCAVAVMAGRRYEPIFLVRCLLIILSETLIFLLATNPGAFLANRGGRVNAPGLEITSTGHIGALALVLGNSLSLPKGYKYSLIVLGAIVLLLSGSRIPFIVSLAIIIYSHWRSANSHRQRVRILLIAGAFGVGAVLVASATSLGGSNLGTFLSGGSELGEEYSIGRGVAILSAIQLISEHPFGYIDSDWAIQAGLVRIGFPSHAHSHLLQSYLRFGPMAIIFWGVLIWEAVLGARRKSPYSASVCFILVGSVLDYYGFVTKAMLVVFMVAMLNEAHIRKHRTESLTFVSSQTHLASA